MYILTTFDDIHHKITSWHYHICIKITCVSFIIHTELKHLPPADVSLQHVGVAHDNQQRLRSGHRYVQSLGVLHKAQVEVLIALQILHPRAHCRDDDDSALFTLKLLTGSHLHIGVVRSSPIFLSSFTS
jgi:hypothetical protein